MKRRSIAENAARQFAPVHQLLLNKYYVDEIYDSAIVQPIRVSQEGLWRGFDVKIIDGAVNGAATIVNGSATMLRRLQTGSVKTYAALSSSASSPSSPTTCGYDMLLTLSWALPLAGAILLLLVPNKEAAANAIRWLALGMSLAAFAVTVAIWMRFDSTSAEFQMVERVPWIPRSASTTTSASTGSACCSSC